MSCSLGDYSSCRSSELLYGFKSMFKFTPIYSDKRVNSETRFNASSLPVSFNINKSFNILSIDCLMSAVKNAFFAENALWLDSIIESKFL